MRPSCLAAAALALALALPATAQDITTSPYAEVRGWTVVSMFEPGTFVGCVGEVQVPGGALAIANSYGGWQIWIPGSSSETYVGGGIAVGDGQFVDSQFGFWSGGAGAYANISDQMVAMIGQGSRLRTQIDRNPVMEWPLAGSAAAIGKIRECVDRMGNTDS
jgi:hypothetical protein